MNLNRRPLITLDEADRRRTPGSVPPAPKSHGHSPPTHVRLLPGEAGGMSHAQLGHRSHQQRLARTRSRQVTFSNGIATKSVNSLESTDKRAMADARKKARLGREWKVVAINGRRV